MKNRLKSYLIVVSIVLIGVLMVSCSEEDKPKSDSLNERSNSENNDSGVKKSEQKPVYTKEELESNSKAPSKDPRDYNRDGEFVPSDGPSSNPADYNFNGEYKPVENMTQEEIEKELLEMLGR